MAGIGFALQKLSSRNSLASRSMAGAHAVLIASGPWIVIMSGLAILYFLSRPVLEGSELTTFSILVIYSFALSLVITAPISMEATLRVSALLYRRRFERVQDVYLGALVVATLAALAIGMFFVFVLLDLEPGITAAAIVCIVQVSHLWLAMAFVAAIKQYAAVTSAFAIGLSCSVVFGVAAARLGYGPAGMLVGFSIGLAVAFCVLNFLILRTFPAERRPLRDTAASLLSQRPLSATFFAASLAGALAVWIDKIVVWHSAEAASVQQGLLYAPRYDSPMFIAYLSIVPVMSVYVVWLETTFFDSYRHYRDIVQSGGTLRQLEEQRRILARDTVDALFTAFLVQLAISAALAILAPVIASWIGLPHDAATVLRLAFLGASFHLLFQASCSVILFVQYGRVFLILQVLFLGLNGAITALMLASPDHLGMGYLLASVAGGIAAYAAMRRTLSGLHRLTFITNNPSVAR
ncbi:exopolysaccharide Pel transporter PelG [Devosia albogilva]|uniref:Exopolysaccharide Pel transporter PelG n=1 Tax=Devosia albogilva TaxID=429726 RepID=A0ABW5QMQ3_9HYPH